VVSEVAADDVPVVASPQDKMGEDTSKASPMISEEKVPEVAFGSYTERSTRNEDQ
jgi:hypothetical protein